MRSLLLFIEARACSGAIEPRSHPRSRPRLARKRREVRPLRRARQRFGDQAQAFVELRVFGAERVLRGDVDFVGRVGAVVLDAPAGVGEPERELGLRGLGAVGETVARVDADDAAPRAHADQRAEAVELEAVAEDVAVAACELVRQRDHRAADRLFRVRVRRRPARYVVGDALAGELLQQQR
jgi:hypothetical protein